MWFQLPIKHFSIQSTSDYSAGDVKLSSEFKPLTTYKDLENTNPTDEANFVQIVREIRDAKLPNQQTFQILAVSSRIQLCSDKDFHSNDKLQSLNFQVLDDGNYKLSAAQILEALV